MDVLNIIPRADALPVASVWFVLLLYLTYYLHLLGTGIMFGGAAVAALGHFKGKTDPNWQRLGDDMSKILPFSIAFTVNLGVAPLLFLQVLYGNFFYSASILMGIPWLLLILVLIGGYYMAYWVVFRKGASVKAKSVVSLLVTLLLAWIAFMLVNVNTLMMTPGKWKGMYEGAMNGMNLNLGELTLFPRLIMYLFMFMAIGGAFVALFYKLRPNGDNGDSALGTRLGALVSGYFSLLLAPAFLLAVLLQPQAVREYFLGGSLVWTVLVIIAALGFLASGYVFFKRKVGAASGLLAALLVLFVFIRNHIRDLYLRPFKEAFSILGETTQYSIMILFFVVLVLGLGLLTWILWKVANERRSFEGAS
jgi:hypothetical protein